MSDHDSFGHRIAAIERFLDVAAPGWKDPKNLDKMRARRDQYGDSELPLAHGQHHGAAHPDMIVDHEQTKADRLTLGLDKPAVVVEGTGSEKEQDERAELMDRLDKYRGTDLVPELSGKESNDELRAIVEDAETNPNQPGVDNPDTSTMTPATAVALEGARANPATEQALQTAEDPARQGRAAEQQAAKAANDAKGGVAAEAVRPA